MWRFLLLCIEFCGFGVVFLAVLYADLFGL
jgi:hypothetical protein